MAVAIVVDYLLRNGADINFKSTNDQAAPKGSTPLFIVASYNGSIGMTKFLLRRGADKNIKNSAGETAHDVAEKYSFYQVSLIFWINKSFKRRTRELID